MNSGGHYRGMSSQMEEDHEFYGENNLTRNYSEYPHGPDDPVLPVFKSSLSYDETKRADQTVGVTSLDFLIGKKSKPVPAVFSRLWQENNTRDLKLKIQRERSRDKEGNDWKMKLAGVN